MTLAEADAELQRLSILRKNHADEQFLTRRAIRELPATIARLESRVEGLSADRAMLHAHADEPVNIGGIPRRRDELMAALTHRLDALPESVREMKRVPLGRYRGLEFGIVLHAGGSAEVYLEGAVTRHGLLARDHRGPRAVLNAVERLADGYGGQLDTARQELAIAQGQRRDHEARLGRQFPHEAYLTELTDLRDRLKAGLSQATPEPGATPAFELAERIKALKAAHTIDAAPERTAPRRLAAETPVTARIRRRAEPAPAIEPPAEPEPVAPAPAAAATLARPAESIQPVVVPLPEAKPARKEPAYREHISRARRPERQLSLF